MAMLAEPRRKVRYTVDPSGQDWARADGGDSGSGGGGGQFGQRMLKSMGWREGQGLGKDGQGAPEPIRVKRKNDQRGVGCTGAYAAESMPQSVDFASLLSQLNEAHGGGGGGGDGATSSCHGNQQAAAVVSLEAKSRSSRARLHYHRFTRGKDVSAYDSQSLACIFGTRGGGAAAAAAVKKEEEAETPAACETVGFGFGGATAALQQSRSVSCLAAAAASHQEQHGLQLVQSQTSLQDYFRAKMQARMLAARKVEDDDDVATEAAAGSSWTSESSCSAASTLLSEPADNEASAAGAAKKVRFSVSPERQTRPPVVPPPPRDDDCDPPGKDEGEEDIVAIDFAQFPGSHWQRVLGYRHY